MKTCSSCGASNADDAKFCETCGMPFPEPAAEPAEEPAKAEDVSAASEAEKFAPPAPAEPEPVTPEPAPAAAAAATVPAVAAAASDYQNDQSSAPKSDYYEEPKTYSGKAIGERAYGIEQRNIVVCILLSIVTCGIYMYYWIYKISEELKQLSGDDSMPDGGIAILLTLVTCGIYLIYWHYKMGQACDQAKGDPNGNSAILYMVLGLLGLGIVSYCLEQNTINELVA